MNLIRYFLSPDQNSEFATVCWYPYSSLISSPPLEDGGSDLVADDPSLSILLSLSISLHSQRGGRHSLSSESALLWRIIKKIANNFLFALSHLVLKEVRSSLCLRCDYLIKKDKFYLLLLTLEILSMFIAYCNYNFLC